MLGAPRGGMNNAALILGVILLVGGVAGYVVFNDQASQCETLLGEAAQALSPDSREQCNTAQAARTASMAATAIGGLLFIAALIGS